MEALVQGSPEWLEFRKNKIGASDVAVIMGNSPYKTAFELWEEKTGRREPPPMNAAMAYGHANEDEIRALYEDQTGKSFLPTIRVHPAFEFMMASLDGITFTGTEILELKTCNAQIFAEAKEGVVVPHYYDQIQAQLACTPEADICHYVCRHRGELCAVMVEPDQIRIDEIETACQEFRLNVLSDTPPEKLKRAGEPEFLVNDDPYAVELAEGYLAGLLLKQNGESIIKKTRPELLDCTDDGNCIIGRLKMKRGTTKGSVDMAKLQAAYGISDDELKKFRKPDTVRWTITMIEDSHESTRD